MTDAADKRRRVARTHAALRALERIEGWMTDATPVHALYVRNFATGAPTFVRMNGVVSSIDERQIALRSDDGDLRVLIGDAEIFDGPIKVFVPPQKKEREIEAVQIKPRGGDSLIVSPYALDAADRPEISAAPRLKLAPGK